MKKIKLFLGCAAMFVVSHSFGQISSANFYQQQDSTTCSNYISIQVDNGPIAETGAIITVDWGDGTPVSTQTFNLPSNNMDFIDFQHGYSTTGGYTATVLVWSSVTNAYVGQPIVEPVAAVTPSNCGTFYINTLMYSPNYQYYNVPYDFTDVNNTTTTIYPVYGSTYNGLNINNGPYTVSISDAWLAANELVQADPDITLTFPNGNGNGYPLNAQIEVTCSNNNTQPDFAFSYAQGLAFLAPLQTGSVVVNLCNMRCSNTSNARVTLTFPAILTPLTTGLLNATISGNTISYDVLYLSECDLSTIYFTFNGATPEGTILPFSADVVATTGTETITTNNNIVFYGFVLNSYDPNNKVSNKPAYINPNVAEEIQYVINFQNEGNSDAVNIVIKDTISDLMDLSTFRVAGSNHAVSYTVDQASRLVTFSFANIFLSPADENEEASKGYVVYSIKEKPNLAVNSEIRNTAYIYFDFNPAIITNTASNINAVLGIEETEAFELQMFPNPASDVLYIQAAEVSAVKIFDFTGKLVVNTANQHQISTSALSNGIYVVKVTTSQGEATRKLVISK